AECVSYAMCDMRELARVRLSNDSTAQAERRPVMESMGDAILVVDATARPGTNPTARWYAQAWEEPRETKTRPVSQHRGRQAPAGVLVALANVLTVPEQRETQPVA